MDKVELRELISSAINDLKKESERAGISMHELLKFIFDEFQEEEKEHQFRKLAEYKLQEVGFNSNEKFFELYVEILMIIRQKNDKQRDFHKMADEAAKELITRRQDIDIKDARHIAHILMQNIAQKTRERGNVEYINCCDAVRWFINSIYVK